jgi:6-phosphogluconolactonase
LKANVYLNLVDNLDEISIEAVKLFSTVHQNSNNRFYIIPGGSTPQLFFNKLALTISDWKNTTFIMSDERIAPMKDRISNEAMFKETFLNEINGHNAPTFFSLLSNKFDIEKKLKLLKPQLTILGMGSDGHTASLFSQNPKIFNNDDIITIKHKNNWENFDRITLSFSYLMKAEKILFLINGKNKARVLERCLNGSYNPQKYPSQYILNNFKNDIHVICDRSAGEYLA